ncbi:MAG: ankyrin repeat domain-containing protein [Acidobacteria bacterium]|nr:ankyrin repeat domain-containing protein [Acidobacteriota bacterium]
MYASCSNSLGKLDIAGAYFRLLALVSVVTLFSASARAFPAPFAATPFANDLRLVEAAQRSDRQAVRSLLEQRADVPADVNARQSDGATALMWAVHWDDLEMVELLLRAGANVNAANDYGATALWQACSNGNAVIMEKLLQAGAGANTALHTGESALMAAAGRNAAAVKLLLAHGAVLDAREPQGGQTALMRAVAEKRVDVARILIEQGADVNARSTGGFTPLLFAAQQNDLESARVLLAAKADVNASSPEASPLLLAAASGYHELEILLLDNRADPLAVDFNGYTALHYAALRRNSLEAIKALLKHGANPNPRIWKEPAKGQRIPIVAVPFIKSEARVIRDGTKGGTVAIGATPFWLAAQEGNAPVMRLLAANGAETKTANLENVYLEGGSGRRVDYMAKTTPLMMVAGVGRVKGNWPEYTAEEESRHLEALKAAVELGGDVNEANEYGYTPLHGAAYVGANTMIAYLVEKGAKLEVFDNFGQTPLSIALHVITDTLGDSLDARPRKYRDDTADVLLKLGAKPLAESGVKILDQLEIHVEGQAGKQGGGK